MGPRALLMRVFDTELGFGGERVKLLQLTHFWRQFACLPFECCQMLALEAGVHTGSTTLCSQIRGFCGSKQKGLQNPRKSPLSCLVCNYCR